MDKKEYLEQLIESRDDYSDEIPKELVYDTPKFKCRRGWFQGFYGNVELGITLGFVNEHAKRLYYYFLEYAKRTNFDERLLTTHEDIRRANEILTSIIGD